jgi:hypothetical protein
MASTQVASSARQAARAALHKARPSPTAALAKPVKRHEKLAKTLEWLTKEPKPILEKVTSLELTYAYRNDHFGARYVVVLCCVVLQERKGQVLIPGPAPAYRASAASYFLYILVCVCALD